MLVLDRQSVNKDNQDIAITGNNLWAYIEIHGGI